jgi:DNA-binding NarL/FixJ family response regulator
VDSRADFTRALKDFQPDVILSDHSLQQFNSLAALEVVRAIRPGIPLIVVSGELDEDMAVACMRAGAESIVLKDRLARLTEVIDEAFAIRAPLEKLTARQLEVLRLVTAGHTSRDIAFRLNLSMKTVETHRAEITKRLGLQDVPGLVRYAVRVGLLPASGESG